MTETRRHIRDFEYAIIHPVSDDYKVTRHTKGKREYAILTHAHLKGAREVCEWADAHLGGHWLVPYIKLENGGKWELNPRRDEDGWSWLLVKG